MDLDAIDVNARFSIDDNFRPGLYEIVFEYAEKYQTNKGEKTVTKYVFLSKDEEYRRYIQVQEGRIKNGGITAYDIRRVRDVFLLNMNITPQFASSISLEHFAALIEYIDGLRQKLKECEPGNNYKKIDEIFRDGLVDLEKGPNVYGQILKDYGYRCVPVHGLTTQKIFEETSALTDNNLPIHMVIGKWPTDSSHLMVPKLLCWRSHDPRCIDIVCYPE